MGVLKRIEPPHIEIRSDVIRITEGTEISTVVVWKKVEIAGPIPVIYIWWAHTMNARKPRTMTA
jgi:hypothetical protein